MRIIKNLFSVILVFVAVSCNRAPQTPEPGPVADRTVPAAVEGAAPPAPEGEMRFVVTSMNIGCHFVPVGGNGVYAPKDGGPELICDRVEPAYVRVSMGPSGPATINENPGDQGCCGEEAALAEGASKTMGPFTCSVAEGDVLTCRRDNGAGFVLSRDKAQLL